MCSQSRRFDFPWRMQHDCVTRTHMQWVAFSLSTLVAGFLVGGALFQIAQASASGPRLTGNSPVWCCKERGESNAGTCPATTLSQCNGGFTRRSNDATEDASNHARCADACLAKKCPHKDVDVPVTRSATGRGSSMKKAIEKAKAKAEADARDDCDNLPTNSRPVCDDGCTAGATTVSLHITRWSYHGTSDNLTYELSAKCTGKVHCH